MNPRRPLTQRHSVFVPRPESPKEEPNPNNIEVCVRMRPLLEPYEDDVVWEVDEATKSIKAKMETADLKSLNLSHPKYYNDFSNSQKFVYDNVEGPGSKTKDLYNKLLKKIVDSVVQGYNGTIFMYGQTTSGKTFTMLGTQKEPGVLPHSIRTIFQSIAKKKDYTFNISVSYLEIYNEVLNDLLVPGSTNLKVVDHPQYGVTVKGLKRQEVQNFEEAIYLVSFGEEHRKYRETNVNEHSSRSHTIYQVFIESFEETPDQVKKRRVSCLNLVDLAGSERLSDNGGVNDLQTGETGHINKSLFLLTNVIKKLADGKTAHIPYRDSKLTRILSNALGGNSLTAVICTISPALINYGQTLSTLRFASRAKRVKNDPTENLIVDIIDQKLKEEVKMLREKLSKSENHITKVNSLNQKLEGDLHSTKQEIQSLQREMEELRTFVTKESIRNPGDTNLSSESLLDIMSDGPQVYKSRSQPYKRSQVFATLSQALTQTNELFFGEQLLSFEPAAESPRAGTGNSIENGCSDMDTKEWNAQCLRIKQNYLRDLKNLQKNYVTSLEEVSQKYISKGNGSHPERATQVKAYVESELQKIEQIQSRVIDAVRKASPNSSKEFIEKPPQSPPTKKLEDSPSPKEQPVQNWESTPRSQSGTPQKGENETESSMKQYYDNVLSRMEKKYDDMYNLVTQSLMKSKDNIIAIEPLSPLLEKKTSCATVMNNGGDFKVLNTEDDMDLVLMERVKLPRRMSERRSSLSRGKRRLDSIFSTFRPESENGRSYSGVLDPIYGNVYLWGSGKDGRLGNGKYTNESQPVPIRDLKFSKLVCGYHNTFGLSQDGLVYGWGRNENSQLGVGSNMNASIPINITPLNKITIVDLACGWQHCLALSSNGRLYSWGCGDEGQLGHGDDFELSAPAEIKFFEKSQVEKIVCGHSQSAAITAEGALYAWGHNSDCRLMISNNKSHFIPTLTEFYKTKLQSATSQEDLEIASISMGATHMCLVTKNGKVYAGGRGNEGQLGQKLSKGMKNVITCKPDDVNQEEADEIIACSLLEMEAFGKENKATMVACGEKFTLVLTDAHAVYSFGDSSDGCLGIEYDEKDKNVFQPRQIEKLGDKKIKSIEAGPRHAACISDSGELYCWGFNYYDHSEVGETEKNYHLPKKIDKLSKYNVSAVSCGYFHTASIVI